MQTAEKQKEAQEKLERAKRLREAAKGKQVTAHLQHHHKTMSGVTTPVHRFWVVIMPCSA